jgi:hypothetical protein
MPYAFSLRTFFVFDALILFLSAGNNPLLFKFTICFVRTGGKY